MTDDPPALDTRLVAAARAGDREALDALVARHGPRVYRFGLAMCRDVEDARDVMQDTFLAMTRSIHTFRAEASITTWLYTIAQRACARRRRRAGLVRRTVPLDETIDSADGEALPSAAPDPEAIAAAEERQAALREALRQLAPGYRAVLLLRDVEGLSASAAAAALGSSVPALKSRLHRARAALRDVMRPSRGPAPAAAAGPRCPDVLGAYSRKLEGDLSAADCAAMEEHLERCVSCRTSCDALRSALAACRACGLPQVPVEVQARVRAAIEASLPRPAPAVAPSRRAT